MIDRDILRRLDYLEEQQSDHDFEARVHEVEEWFAGCRELYNSPEEVKRREEERAVFERRGEERKRAFYRWREMKNDQK